MILEPLFFSFFLFFYVTQLIYYIFLFSKIISYQKNKIAQEKNEKKNIFFPPISIIICAKNEAANLSAKLPFILQQNYPKFEVIVVNDASEDATSDVLQVFQEKYPHLKIIHVPSDTVRNMQGKKFALSRGLKEAEYDIVLLTDADCEPVSESWAMLMVTELLDSGKDIVLGYSPYKYQKGFLNQFIRFETIYTAMQYFSFAIWGKPYMGVGRNLLYRKKIFEKTGFEKHAHIASGDDDLFISEVATKKNTSILLSQDSFVFSEPKTNWKAYYRQKSRHLSTGTKYKFDIKFHLGLISLSHFGFFGCFLFLFLIEICVIISKLPLILLLLFLVRFLVIQYIGSKIVKIFKDKKLLYFFALFDLIYIIFYLVFFLSLFNFYTTKSYSKWK